MRGAFSVSLCFCFASSRFELMIRIRNCLIRRVMLSKLPSRDRSNLRGLVHMFRWGGGFRNSKCIAMQKAYFVSSRFCFASYRFALILWSRDGQGALDVVTMNLSPTTVTSQGHSSTANSGNATASTVGASTNGNWARCKVKYDHNTPNWWKRISEDTEYRPQEQDGISKRRQEYRLAIEENTLLRGITPQL